MSKAVTAVYFVITAVSFWLCVLFFAGWIFCPGPPVKSQGRTGTPREKAAVITAKVVVFVILSFLAFITAALWPFIVIVALFGMIRR